MIKMNEEQREAALSTATSMAVSAGAGSGKTAVLVERFVTLVLKKGIAVEEIMAVTFTRKAAGEMKQRIRQRLSEEGLSPKEYVTLSEAMSRAWIGTIHSICERILLDNPVEADIDPAAAIMDEAEAGMMFDEAARSVILAELDHMNPEVTGWLAEAGLAGVIAELRRIRNKITDCGLTVDEVEEVTEKAYQALEGSLPGHLDLVAEALKRLADLSGEPSVARNESARGKAEQARSLLDNWNAMTATGIIEYGGLHEAVLAIAECAKGRVVAAMSTALSQVKEVARQTEEILVELERRPRVIVALDLIKKVDQAFRRAKDRANKLEFSDLEEKTVRLFSERPDILDRYQRHFKQVMVDEFQDTNYRQAYLFQLLCQGSQVAPLFVVGDRKQSIYRFRGAVASLFEKAAQDIAASGGQRHLMRNNFRTRKPLIDFVNYFFGVLMQDGESCYEELTANRLDDGEGPAVELNLVFRDSPDSGLTAAEAEAHRVAARIKQLVEEKAPLVYERDQEGERAREVRYGDIAILFRAGTRMPTFAHVLSCCGIPVEQGPSRDFFASEEVSALLHALRAVAQVNEMELAGAMRSSLFGVSDNTLWCMRQACPSFYGALAALDGLGLTDEEKGKLLLAREVLDSLRTLHTRLTAGEVLESLLEKTGYEYFLASLPEGRRRLEAVRNLGRMAAELATSGKTSLIDFLAYVEALREASAKVEVSANGNASAGAVRMMTVHQAKGLEFPVVVIPETDRQYNQEEVNASLLVSDGIGLYLNGKPKGILRTRAEDREREREREEEKRLLYVAATRARDYLIVSGCCRVDQSGQLKIPADSWLSGILEVFQCQEQIAPEAFQPYCHVTICRQSELDSVPQAGSAIPCGQTAMEVPAFVAEPVKGQDGPRRLSATAIMDWNNCPRHYWLRHIIRLPEARGTERGEEDRPAGGLTAAERGDLVHRALQLGHDLAEAEKIMRDLVNRVAPIRADDVHYGSLDRYLKNYFKSVVPEMGEDNIQKEIPFVVKLSNGDYLRGAIDQLWEKDGVLHILDLKTNRIDSEETREILTGRYAVQLSVYREALRQVLGREEIRGHLLYLDDGKLVSPENLPPLTLPEEDYSPKEDHCERCGYQIICHPVAG